MRGSSDPARRMPTARDRTFAAILDMKKLDLAALQAAFEGT